MLAAGVPAGVRTGAIPTAPCGDKVPKVLTCRVTSTCLYLLETAQTDFHECRVSPRCGVWRSSAFSSPATSCPCRPQSCPALPKPKAQPFQSPLHSSGTVPCVTSAALLRTFPNSPTPIWWCGDKTSTRHLRPECTRDSYISQQNDCLCLALCFSWQCTAFYCFSSCPACGGRLSRGQTSTSWDPSCSTTTRFQFSTLQAQFR